MSRNRLNIIASIAAIGLVAGIASTAAPQSSIRFPPNTPATPASSPSASPPPEANPIAAIVYPNNVDGDTLATVDANGTVRECVLGKRIVIGDVQDGWILYANGDLFEIPLACNREPRRVFELGQLKRAPAFPSPEIGCASYSPNGKRIAFAVQGSWCDGMGATWVASRSRLDWKNLGDVGGGLWVDDRHLLARYITGEPHVINVDSGKAAFLELPFIWEGVATPNLSRFDYLVRRPETFSVLRGLFKAGVYTYTREHGPSRSGSPPPPGDLGPLTNWNASSTRYVLPFGGGDHPATLLVSGRGGGIQARVLATGTLIREATTYWPGIVTYGWLGEEQLWAWVGDELLMGSAADRELIPITLPNFGRGQPGRAPHASALRVFSQGIAWEGFPGDPMVYEADATPWHRNSDLGIAFRLPPSWQVLSCRCAGFLAAEPYPYPSAFVVASSVDYAAGESPPWHLTFTTTSDAVARVIERLSHAYQTDLDPERGGSRLRRSSTTIGGRRFEILELGFYEGAMTIYVGRVGDRTFIIEAYLSATLGPGGKLILGTMSFD
ncbi:MAG: hypothetical protein ACRDKS_17435 [Actinomycetota bacterium]